MNKIKAMITQVLQAPDVVPALVKYIAGQTGKAEGEILESITQETGGLEGKQFIRKFYSAEKIDVVDSERSVVGVISTSSKDRDREVVDPEGAILTDYQKNRVVLYGHDYHGLPIGRNMWIKRKGNALIAKTQFASRPADLPESQPWLPDQVYHLMKEGMLNGFSIGFIPLEERELQEAETKSGVERAWAKWLMLEYSIVAVPSNPEAVAIEIKSGAINHPQLVSDLEIEIEETKEMKTEKESPKEEKVTVEIAERGIWAELTDEGPEFYFDEENYSDADSKAWVMTFGEAVKDILEDEVIKGEDGLPDPELLKAALDKLDMETTSGDGESVIEIEIDEAEEKDGEEPKEEKPEEGDETEAKTGEDTGEDGEEAKGPAEEDGEDGEEVEVELVVSEDVKALVSEIKSIREEVAEMKEGRVLSKSTRSLVEQAISALQELLEKADSRAVTEEAPPEDEKEFEIEANDPVQEKPVTKEQIEELLNQPDTIAFIKAIRDKKSGKM